MRKQLLSITAIVAAFFSTSACAQVRVSPGVVVGVDFMNMSVTPASPIAPDSRTGFTAGAVLDIAFSKNFSLQPGIVYSGRGFTVSTSGTESGLSYSAKDNDALHYLAIPIDFKAKYAASPNFMPYALVGLNTAFFLSGSDHGTGSVSGYVQGYGPVNLTIDTTADISKNFNSMDFGLDLGAGLEFPTQSVTPFIEFVYYLGIANIADDPSGTATATNNGFEIKAGIKFKTK
jgi:opacity protein-like surface antigen